LVLSLTKINNTLTTYNQVIMILTLFSFSIFKSKTGHNLAGPQILRINETQIPNGQGQNEHIREFAGVASQHQA